VPPNEKEMEKFIDGLALEMAPGGLERNTCSDIDVKLFDRGCDPTDTTDVSRSERI
jgi:hypothetical protein